MTEPLIYHGTPITPNAALDGLEGRAFCIRHGAHGQAQRIEQIAAFAMYDNGAFSKFTKGKATDWPSYYAWLEPRLFHPGRWAVIPDEIDAGTQLQDALIVEWPYGERGAPVWHTDEPIDRLAALVAKWPRVCIGSTGEHWEIPRWNAVTREWFGGESWRRRMDEAWKMLSRQNAEPVIHMLRGTAVARLYPFVSADSSSLAQNHWRRRWRPLALFPDLPEPKRIFGTVAYADYLERIGA